MDKKKELYFDEKTWERYVASHPEVFLGESLRLRSQQETAQSGRFDLTFWDEENRIVLVEIQLRALDRTHWFKVLEYHKDLLEEGYLDVRIIILCNEIDPRRDYVNVYKDNLSLDINVITMAENEAKLAIQQIDPSIIFSKAPLQKKKQDKTGNNQVEVPISEYIDLHRKASETDRAVKKLEERTDASLNLVMQNLPYDIRIMVWSSYQDDKKYRNLDDWEDHFVSLVCEHAKVIKNLVIMAGRRHFALFVGVASKNFMVMVVLWGSGFQ